MTSTTTISGLPDASAPLHGAERLPLDDLVAGATRDASTLQIAQTLPDATTTSRGAMTAAQALKLSGIATGATVNATDAALRDRATHTGTQAIGTITGLADALASKVSSVGLDTPAGQGLSVSNSPVNSSGTLVISVASGYQIPTTAQLASFLTSATAVTTYQPLDSDLTAIAALSTTSFGRGLLALADAAAGRTTLGLGTSSTPQFAGLGLTGGNLTARQSATQDAIIVSGRSGGNGSFSVTFTPATLTASQTLTAPNVSGTIVTTGDTGTVTSAMIANGTIVNDDISASAAIADGKLGTISTAGKVSNSATTATSSNTPGAIVARDGSGNFTANVITASLTGNVTGNLTGTASAIADGTVTSDKIVNGTIVDADISNSAAIALSKLATGALPTAITVASVNIVDGTIVDADINASAEIAVSKLADGSARQLLQTDTAGTGVEWTSNVDIPGTLDVTGTATFDSIASHPLGAAGTPSITFTGDLNTGIWSPGADQLAFSTAGNERARIDSSGRLLIGASTNYLIGDSSGWTLQASNSAGISNLRTGDDSAPSYLVLAKTRATSAGSFARLENNDIIGDISFVADDGTDYATNAAKIRCHVDGTPGADDMPGRLVFLTTADGASGPAERMRITSGGNVGIGITTVRSGLHLYGAGQATANITDSGDRAAFLRLSQSGTSTNTGGGILFASEQADNANSAGFAAIKGLLTDGSNNTAGQLAFSVRGTSSASTLQEAMRIDGAGRLLIGTSASVPALVESGLQLHSIGANSWLNIGRWSNNSENAGFVFSKSRGVNVGTRAAVLSGDGLGAIYFSGDDGSSFVNAVQITALADGTPGANDMPGRLVFSTTVDGASSPTEALRITNDKVIAYNQAAPVSKSTAATLTIAELKGGIIEYTGNAQTLTLPTGTSSEGGFSGLYNNMTFEWSVINTGSGTCTVAGNTGHTVVGAGAVAAGSSGRFASRRTGANTFVTYRLS